MLASASITLHQMDYKDETRNGSIQSANFSKEKSTGWQIDYTGTEKNSGYIAEIKSRYAGLEESLSFLAHHACAFLCVCSIIEEVNGKPIEDLIGVVREIRERGLICEQGIKNTDYVKILEMYTDRKWSFRVLTKITEPLNDNDFVVECHFVPEQIKPIDEKTAWKVEQSLHARRVFKNGDTLDPSRCDNLLDEIKTFKIYVIFTCE